ncbi:MAG: hypothetical protein ACM359_12750 [Bacillota bacterium]
MSEEEIKREAQLHRETQQMKRVGDNLEDEPDAVDIKQPGEQTEGVDIEETWHRAGGKSPGTEEKKPAQPTQSDEESKP